MEEDVVSPSELWFLVTAVTMIGVYASILAGAVSFRRGTAVIFAASALFAFLILLLSSPVAPEVLGRFLRSQRK